MMFNIMKSYVLENVKDKATINVLIKKFVVLVPIKTVPRYLVLKFFQLFKVPLPDSLHQMLHSVL